MINCCKKISILILIVLIVDASNAQVAETDSLLNLMRTSKDQKITIDAANQYAYKYYLKTNNIDSALKVANT